jgi:beta-xylosidase
MKNTLLTVLLTVLSFGYISAQNKLTNPVIFADVPDPSMIRVGDTYYMSSTTMHMIPGVPIMASKDLANWKLVSYALPFLVDNDDMNLANGRTAYGKGTWASSLRYHKGTYYLSVFSSTSNRSYICTTNDPTKGDWKTHVLPRSLHDMTLFFDDDEKIYMIWGGGRLNIIEVKPDLSDFVPGTEKVLIENASKPGGNGGLNAEGSHLYKYKGYYYLFNISWPSGKCRTVLVHRATSIMGPWEGRVALQDQGVAQGGFIETPDGRFFAYLFQDHGSVGRIPWLVPMKWEDGWPVIGIDGKVTETLDLPASKGLIPGIVNSDEFTRKSGEPKLPLVWQWNHNPLDGFWSVDARKGYLRLTTGRIDTTFVNARNTLTQRTIGPECTGYASFDVSNMKVGDVAGLGLLQKKYGQVGVRCAEDGNYIVMINGQGRTPVEVEKIPLKQKTLYVKIQCDYVDRKDIADFFYSLDGKKWTKIGTQLKMNYDMPHFVGYRFALFNYAWKTLGGYVDFDYFRIENSIVR